MKTVIIAIAAAMLSINAAAYDPGIDPDKYCIKVKEGKTIVEHNGREITKDITLKDGTKIKTDGSVVKSDGSTIVLKAGECFNKDNVSDLFKSGESEESDKPDKSDKSDKPNKKEKDSDEDLKDIDLDMQKDPHRPDSLRR